MDEHYLEHPTHEVLQMQDFLLTNGYKKQTTKGHVGC
jgi:hypothetical protein